jgi:DHA2 family multidrug resistance protein
MQQGASPGDAHNQAMGFVGQLVQSQASILAYIDVFHVCAIVAALMIPIVLVLVRHVQIHRGGAVAGH